MKQDIPLNRAAAILQKHYGSVLKGRKITKQEVIAEAQSLLLKWDDNVFLANMDFMHRMDKADWEKVAKEDF